MRANKIQVNQRIYVENFIGDHRQSGRKPFFRISWIISLFLYMAPNTMSNPAANENIHVDFFILHSTVFSDALHYTCRLAEKAFQLNHRVLIHISNQSVLAQLLELLWTFKATSFLPHATCSDPDAEKMPVIISQQTNPVNRGTVLISLTQTFPDHYKEFRRIYHIVPKQSHLLNQARGIFRQYRNLRIEPRTIRL